MDDRAQFITRCIDEAIESIRRIKEDWVFWAIQHLEMRRKLATDPAYRTKTESAATESEQPELPPAA